MAVKTYSLKKDGKNPLTVNFKVKEFAQKDGKEDTILIDDRLVRVLQVIRDSLNKPIRINSGYRTAEYNRQIGGATNSQHIKGTAADIAITGVTPFNVACAAEKAFAQIGVKVGGIGQYANFTHIDVRSGGKWRQNMTTGQNVSGFFAATPPPAAAPLRGGESRPTIRNGSRGEDVRYLQQRLNILRKAGLTEDGVFGGRTDAAVKAFQKANGLTVDGVVGPNTWRALG
jgi:hypothetical protein